MTGIDTADDTAAVIAQSAPASTAAAASASVRMPPPTASGMKSSRATREIVSASARRASRVAVTSRITSSSMPSALYRRASSAGSPADRSPSKLTPLTTWPFLTSRQAMMRLESIAVVEHTEVKEDAEGQATETLRHRERLSSLLRQRENLGSVSRCLRGYYSLCPLQPL